MVQKLTVKVETLKNQMTNGKFGIKEIILQNKDFEDDVFSRTAEYASPKIQILMGLNSHRGIYAKTRINKGELLLVSQSIA